MSHRHLMARMGRTAAAWNDAFKNRSDGRRPERYYSNSEDYHRPHEDWREYGSALYPDLPEWVRHFPHGESHVRYSINPRRDDGEMYNGQKKYLDRGGAEPESWYVHHEGVWHGHQHRDRPEGGKYDFTSPVYKRERDGSPENVRNGPAGKWTAFLGDFPTADAAKAAVEDHFRRFYGDQPKPGPDYYDDVLRRIDLDDDYGDIFGEGSR